MFPPENMQFSLPLRGIYLAGAQRHPSCQDTVCFARFSRWQDERQPGHVCPLSLRRAMGTRISCVLGSGLLRFLGFLGRPHAMHGSPFHSREGSGISCRTPKMIHAALCLQQSPCLSIWPRRKTVAPSAESAGATAALGLS